MKLFLHTLSLAVMLAVVAVPAFAQTTVSPQTAAGATIEGTAGCVADGSGYCLLEPLPIGTSGTVFDRISSQSTLSGYLNTFFKIGIGIVGVLAVIMLIVGGVQYMTTDAFSGKESGKESITNAIGGLILALASYLILVTINPQLVSLQFGVHEVEVEGTGFSLPASTEFQKKTSTLGPNDTGPYRAFGSGTEIDTLAKLTAIQAPATLECGQGNLNECKVYGEAIDTAPGISADMKKFLKANMAEESTCRMKAVSSMGACGPFQQLPSTAQMYAKAAGVDKSAITCGWLTNPSNIQAIIRIQVAFIDDLKKTCGSDWRNIAAGQNGGPGACQGSANAQTTDKSPINGSKVQKWEYLWDDNSHTVWNKGYHESRVAMLKLMQCYNHPKF